MKVYICDIKNLLDLPGTELLTSGRRTYMYRFQQNADRARCLAAGLMLRRILGDQQVGCIQTGKFGKPFLPGGPCFSISHSGDHVLVALDDREIGVDIEQILPWQPEMAQMVFTAAERAWLARQPGNAAFYRLWTGKEAIMKVLGLGFQLPPESFEVLPDDAGPNAAGGRNWYLRWKEIKGYMLCVASEQMGEFPEPVQLSRNELLKE